jgi:PTS system mannitol-specific IIC component
MLLERLIKAEAEGAEIAGQAGNDGISSAVQTEPTAEPVQDDNAMLKVENIKTGLAPESKEDAIRRVGRLLHESGYVDASYIDAMIERENLTTTYMGMGLAIPHGTSEAKAAVKKSGIAVLQYPEGVEFEDEKAHLIIGIAGVGDSHLEILAKVSEALEDEDVLERLSKSADASEIYETLK